MPLTRDLKFVEYFLTSQKLPTRFGTIEYFLNCVKCYKSRYHYHFRRLPLQQKVKSSFEWSMFFLAWYLCWCSRWNKIWVDSCHYLRAWKLLKPATLLKFTLLDGCFSCFLNCTNRTKSRNASQISNLVSLTSLI